MAAESFSSCITPHPSVFNFLSTCTLMRCGHLSTNVPLYPCFAKFHRDQKKNLRSQISDHPPWNLEGAEFN